MNEFEKIWNKLSPNVKGFIFILMASATFPIMGTIVKYLSWKRQAKPLISY